MSWAVVQDGLVLRVRQLTTRHVLILEWVAFWAMVIDHLSRTGMLVIPGWTIVGRIAFPLFGLTFAYNVATYRRCNVNKLALLGVLAQPASMYLMHIQWWQPNVMFTFPVGWWAYRFFVDRQTVAQIYWKTVALSVAIATLTMGPTYDVRGVAMIALAIAFFTAQRRGVQVIYGVSAVGCFVTTLAGAPGAIAPVMALLVGVVWAVMRTSGGDVRRVPGGWWRRAGFGKWYVVHLWVLGAIKAVMGSGE